MRLDMNNFVNRTSPFSFGFGSTATGRSIIDTENQTLVIQDKFMQMDMKLPSQRIYGFGERTRTFDLGEGTWTMWANGQETPHDDGMGGKQTYGVHPFVLV
jgi:hypothetical protein